MRKWRALAATTAIVVATCAWAGPALADVGCFDRRTQPYTSVVDSHLHLRPFGGQGIPLTEMGEYWRKTGVRFVNLYGIGQILPVDSACTYYLDCLGTPVLPSPKNDVENAHDVDQTKIDGVQLILSMTFPDLANPAGILDQMRQLDSAYPGKFRWMGEVNLIKQALSNNGAQPAGLEDIVSWWPFMDELRRRDMPITIHSDLGNDAEPLKYLYLMEAVLNLYPDNKIVWPHMGLSNELATMDPALHIDTLRRLMDQHPKLYLDISWRVLDESIRNQRRVLRPELIANHSGNRFRRCEKQGFLGLRRGTRCDKPDQQVPKRQRFRDIALGQSYFDLLGVGDQAPPICSA